MNTEGRSKVVPKWMQQTSSLGSDPAIVALFFFNFVGIAMISGDISLLRRW
jgi:hypothetical protein